MTGFVYGDRVPPATRRLAERLGDELRAIGVLGAVHDVAVAVGAEDLGLARRSAGARRVLVPALAGRALPRWAAGLVASSASVLVFDVAELTGLPIPADVPVVVTGLPRPPERPAGEGLAPGAATGRMIALWTAEAGPARPDGPGVAWVGGGPAAALPAALEAWAERRAVVALPGTRRHPLLAAGGALLARTSLEVVEATRLLCQNRPLARTLADRGRRRLAGLDGVDVVAQRAAEAILLAGDRT